MSLIITVGLALGKVKVKGISLGFLDEADEYIKALERVQKDLHFIDTQFDEIEDEKEFIAEVKDELEKTGSDMTAFNQKRDLWRQARESDLVRNAQMMRQTTQEIKDLYYHLMQHSAEQLSEACVELLNRADVLRKKCSAYPEEWNVSIYNKVKGLEQSYPNPQLSLKKVVKTFGDTEKKS